MRGEIINNLSSGNCAPDSQSIDRELQSNAEPFARHAPSTRELEDPYRPKRRHDVAIRLIEGEVVVLDRQAGLIHQLNHTASYIWDRCAGQFTVAEIAKQLALTFDVEPNTAAEDAAIIIRQFQGLRLLEPC